MIYICVAKYTISFIFKPALRIRMIFLIVEKLIPLWNPPEGNWTPISPLGRDCSGPLSYRGINMRTRFFIIFLLRSIQNTIYIWLRAENSSSSLNKYNPKCFCCKYRNLVTNKKGPRLSHREKNNFLASWAIVDK